MTPILRFPSFCRRFAGRAALGALIGIGALSFSSGDAAAQSALSGDWTMTIGAEGRVVPQFEGASSYRIRPMPIFSIRRAGAPSRFKAPDDGIRIGLIEVENVRVGAVGKFRGRRAESDAAALQGLGNVGFAVELGAFAEIWATQNFRLSAEIRHGLGGHTGVMADLGADVVLRPDSQLTLSAGPRVAWSNAEYNRTYFGVNAQQRARGSRLALYNPGSGFRSLGFVGSASYAMTPDWSIQAFARYDRLVGDVRNAPLVRAHGSPNQFSAGLGFSYSFHASTR